MDIVTLSQWQFAITSIYHFFFVPLTLGLSVLVAIMETIYVNTGKQVYKRMTQFWGRLFLINFAMGVVTGIVQEFQFGMNWAEYSRYVGDIFGAPLAIEALLAFFLESTFLGVWIFSWDKLSKGWHAVTIWLVAIGSNLSALWILIANSFMQQPQGYVIEGGRAVMTDFAALVFNANVWLQFPHVVFSGLTTGAFFVMGISAYHILRNKKEQEFFNNSFQISAIAGIIAIFMVILVGHSQAQHMVRTQPMKMAAAEALWDGADPASLSLFTIGDQANMRDVFSIRIPGALSFLAYNQFSGRVEGINELQAMYEKQYGPGNYVPSVFINYWTFRIMVGLGFLMLAIAAYVLFQIMRKKLLAQPKLIALLPFAIALPYLSNTAGWILTEVGRQPWVVFGLLKTQDAVSPILTPGLIWISLIGFTLVYGALMVVDVYLLRKFAQLGPAPEKKAGEKQPKYAQADWE
jgi:cytochrome d ubiquinol oxidase subunit I